MDLGCSSDISRCGQGDKADTMMKHKTIALLVFLSMAVSDSRVVLAPVLTEKDQDRSPYYFGSQEIVCTGIQLIEKRDYPSRSTLTPVHGLVKYKYKVYDWMPDSVGRVRPAANVSGCFLTWEGTPAAESSLATFCIDNCASSYRGEFGTYNPVTNNCHHFANKISEVLYGNSCPSWCN